MPRDYEVTIAGKDYRLRYRLPDRAEIEDRAAVNGTVRSLLDVMGSGRVIDQALVVWAGIKGANPDSKITPRGIVEKFQLHNERDGDFYQDVLSVAYVAVAESGLLGKGSDVTELRRVFGFHEGKDGAGEAEASATVRAAE